MKDLYEDFIEGDEVMTIKHLVAKLNAFTATGAVFGYLILLDLIPKFTLYFTAMAVFSLFLTHFMRKWTADE